MTQFKLRHVFLVLTLVLIGPGTAAQEMPSSRPERIIVISLDGARPDAILEADTPNIKALAERGAVSWEASTVVPSATVQAHASMLTGLNVNEHGVIWNNYSEDSIEVLTFITMTQEAGYSSAMVVGKEKFKQFHQTDDVNYTFARAGDHSVTNRALELLNDGVEVLFIHYPNPDYFGHLSGWMGSIYMREMSNTDFEVGRLLNHLEENDWLQETLIILTADHGGSGTSHGSSRPADMLIPWIIAGPGVIQGAVLQEQVYVMDTAQTVLWVLELPLPSSEYGKPVFEAFGLETTGS